MKHHTGNRIAALSLAGLLSACGGGNAEITPPAPSSEYAGHVVDENGAPVPGISVRLENRTTDEITEAITTTDGSFSATVEPGVFEVIFDDPGAAQYVSVQKTSVDLRKPKTVKVQLPTAAPQAHNLLKGTVTYQDGKPAAHREILIDSMITRSSATEPGADIPDPVMVKTDAWGGFSLSLGKQRVDIYFDAKIIAANAPELDIEKLAFNYQFASESAKTAFFHALNNYIARYAEESININKPDGPMQMELVLGSPVRNLRSATGTFNEIPDDERQLVLYTEKHGSKNNPPAPPAADDDLAENLFNLERGMEQAGATSEIGKFSGGKMKISTTCGYKTFKEITTPTSGPFDTEYSRNTSICSTLTKFSRPLYTHKILFKTDRKSKYKFTDESNDVYTLSVRRSNRDATHVIRYKSEAPAIVAIAFKLPPAPRN